MSTILDDSRNRLPVRMAEVVAVRVRKMTLVAGDDVIGLCGLRAVQKFRVGRVGRNGSRDVRLKELTLIVEHGEHRRDLVRRKREFRPREHGRVFLEDWDDAFRHIPFAKYGGLKFIEAAQAGGSQ